MVKIDRKREIFLPCSMRDMPGGGNRNDFMGAIDRESLFWADSSKITDAHRTDETRLEQKSE